MAQTAKFGVNDQGLLMLNNKDQAIRQLEQGRLNFKVDFTVTGGFMRQTYGRAAEASRAWPQTNCRRSARRD